MESPQQKVLDYGVQSTGCRKCDSTIGESKPSPRDCRKNHCVSSKSMKPEIAITNDAPNHALKYCTYTGDEDATTESHVKYRVGYDTVNKTDKNHATRTLGSRLYSAQKNVKGLTVVGISLITYIIKLFAYCISTNQGKPEEIKNGLKTLVCHAFDDHGHCDSKWCGALKDPTNFKFKDLPRGKQLSGENLRAAIDAIKPFETEEWCKKLANWGSSQANECVNSIVQQKRRK